MANSKIGVIGCGTIAEIYIDNIQNRVQGVDVIACNDVNEERAKDFAQRYNIPKVCSFDEMLADPEISLILNLTIPNVHYELNMKAMAAGKNVYCEKPFGVTYDEVVKQMAFAKEKGVFLACAPDTFLGQGVQLGRKIIDSGDIGDIISFNANMMYYGPDLWHPTAEFYYAPGGGPMLDMGPYFLTALTYLIGPIKKISCFNKIGKAERKIHGKMLPVQVPTTYTCILEMANGAIGNVNMSFDVWHTDCPNIEIFGSAGAIQLPDPNGFGGRVFCIKAKPVEEYAETLDPNAPALGPGGKIGKVGKAVRDAYVEVTDCPFPSGGRLNMRGIGVADVCAALASGRASRVSGEHAQHVAEALEGVQISAETGKIYEMTTTFTRSAPMPENVDMFVVD